MNVQKRVIQNPASVPLLHYRTLPHYLRRYKRRKTFQKKPYSYRIKLRFNECVTFWTTGCTRTVQMKSCLKKSRGRSRDIRGRRPSQSSSSCSWATPAQGIILKGLVAEDAPHLLHWFRLTPKGRRHHQTPSMDSS